MSKTFWAETLHGVGSIISGVQAIHAPLGCDTAVTAHAYHHHDSACFTNDISQSEDHQLGSALLRDIVSAFSGDIA